MVYNAHGIVELSDMNGSITLDSELQEACNGMTSLNNRMSGAISRRCCPDRMPLAGLEM